jgi:hypothetical protein
LKTAAKNSGLLQTKPVVKEASKPVRRKVSPAMRKKMAEAARARWAARKNAAKQQSSAKEPMAEQTAPKSTKGGITAAQRNHLSKLAKARGAEKNKEHH